MSIVPVDPDPSAISPDADPTAVKSPREGDALDLLEKLIGTVEGPADLAAEHDHYLYGTPKRAARES